MEGPGIYVPLFVALVTGMVTFLLSVSGRRRAAMWVTLGLTALPVVFGLWVQAVDTHGTAGLGAIFVIALLLLPALVGAALGWGLGALAGRRGR